ncbi:MAG: hypothetical protein PVG51_10555 [Desulfosarcina sp.]|jgi:hypothetical protein
MVANRRGAAKQPLKTGQIGREGETLTIQWVQCDKGVKWMMVNNPLAP